MFKHYVTLLTVGVSLLFGVGPIWSAAPQAETASVILEETVRFLDPKGADILLVPGTYHVQADPPYLLVSTKDGQPAITIKAEATQHQEQLDRPVALSIPEADNVYHIVLILPGGIGFDAAGYTGEIRSRGPRKQSAIAPSIVSSQLRFEQRAAFPVVQFVRPIYFEGLPTDKALSFGGDSVPLLLDMLGDPLEQASWGNIVVLLGMIGDPRAVDPLIGFLEQPGTGDLSRSHYKAKTAVLPALGYLLNKQPTNQTALAYLQDSRDPTFWGKRQLGWNLAPSQGGGSARDLRLTEMAIMGLALSGHPTAKNALQSLQAGMVPGAVPYQKQIAPMLGEAMKAHGVIAQNGIKGYYQAEAAKR
jgi:hypothetical protein